MTNDEIDSLVEQSLTLMDTPKDIIKDIRIMWPEVSLPSGIEHLRNSLIRLGGKGNMKAIFMKTEWDRRQPK